MRNKSKKPQATSVVTGVAFKIALTILSIFSAQEVFAAGNSVRCQAVFGIARSLPARFAAVRPEVEEFRFNMPGMKVSSLSDPTLATGATLFKFEEGATANFDARGGSVAAVETTLLEEASYSNTIDGILFAGGSTMGLEATQGVRRRIFEERAQNASNFDFIPSIPGAVVYDFGGRVEPTQNPLIFPGLIMGAALHDSAVENRMLIGRVGAGTSTTANKISQPIWGGQGAAFAEVSFGDGFNGKIFVAVIMNPHGDVTLPPGATIDEAALRTIRSRRVPRAPRQNTTLSIVVTDLALDRSQLKRLAMMVHTSMAGSIFPFHSYSDGDINYAVSLQKKQIPAQNMMAIEEGLQVQASLLMRDAIYRSVTVSNRLGTPRVQGSSL